MAIRKSTMPKKVIYIWKLVLQIQTRVGCFIITSFCVEITLAVQRGSFVLQYVNGVTLTIISSIIFTVEYIFSFIVQYYFIYKLPSKSFLASKSTRTEIFTIIQKLILQALRMILPLSTYSSFWIYSVTSTVTCAVRDWHFISTLPFYKTKALLYQAHLLIVLSSLNFAFLALQICSYSTSDNMTFIIVVWAILIILSTKVLRNYFHRSLLKLLVNSRPDNTQMMVQRIFFLKEIMKQNRPPMDSTSQYEYTYLLNIIMSKNLTTIFYTPQGYVLSTTSYTNKKEAMNRIFVDYLENLSKKFPNNNGIKLLTAYFYAKKTEALWRLS